MKYRVRRFASIDSKSAVGLYKDLGTEDTPGLPGDPSKLDPYIKKSIKTAESLDKYDPKSSSRSDSDNIGVRINTTRLNLDNVKEALDNRVKESEDMGLLDESERSKYKEQSERLQGLSDKLSNHPGLVHSDTETGSTRTNPSHLFDTRSEGHRDLDLTGRKFDTKK